MSKLLEEKKEVLLKTKYGNCETDKEFQHVYMAYINSKFKPIKLLMAMKKLQSILDDKMKTDETTDEQIVEFSKQIEQAVIKSKALKTPNFSGLEFIAMTYIYADHKQ